MNSASEYRGLIAQLGLSQIRAARLLGVDERTSRRWAAGVHYPHPSVTQFLRYLIKTGKTGEKALRVLEPVAND
jgi:DNA-binding transcriptional regulator YiaG